MSKAKSESSLPKLPFQQVSRFSGGKGMFGNANNQKFSPKTKVVLPPVRITQNKGGGGK